MAESVGAFEFYLQETLKDLSENGKQIDLKPEQGAAITCDQASFLFRGGKVIVSGVPSRREKKNKGRLIAG